MADRNEAETIGAYAATAVEPVELLSTVRGGLSVIAGSLTDWERGHHDADLQLRGVDDVVTLCGSDLWTDDPSIFVADTEVCVVMRGNDRRIRAVMPLAPAPQWLGLLKMFDRPLKGRPEELVEALRFEYSDTGAATSSVVGALRDTRFTVNSEQSTSVRHGGNTMGKSLNAAVDKSDSIPEEFPMTLRPFLADGCDFSVTVQIGVIIDPVQGLVTLRPLAGEIERAQAAAISKTRARLSELLETNGLDTVLVFGGSPQQ